MQFNRSDSGQLSKLPKPSVDTGMGLERIAAVLQNVHSNYEIDMFQSLIKASAVATEVDDLGSNSLKVIADHIRACSFLITDGVVPTNEGRGYVLRRIIRRAIRHGYKLGKKDPFFHRLVSDVALEMGEAFPEIAASQKHVASIIREEEVRFAQTLDNGMGLLEMALLREDGVLDGETVFRLYDTYGFPVDLTADIARERNMRLDLSGFEAAMESQRERARASSKFQKNISLSYEGEETKFFGYQKLITEAVVVAIYINNQPVGEINEGDSGVVVLNQTPFYAESGGQIGDRGELLGKATPFSNFIVNDTQTVRVGVVGHHGFLKQGKISIGDNLDAQVDRSMRQKATCNHSATHLMHAALRQVLGDHVQQKGSLVDEDKTRFDFSNNKPLSGTQISSIEKIVNEQVRQNISVTANVMSYDKAVEEGALALFGEKYSDTVRVVGMDNFSKELCGGTHVSKTGEIGLFKIIEETGVAAGVRRIEAATGDRALSFIQNDETELKRVRTMLKASPEEMNDKLKSLLENIKLLERDNTKLRSKLAASQGGDIVTNAELVKGMKVIATVVENADIAVLRQTMDQVKTKLTSGIIVLAAVRSGNVILVAGVTEDLSDQFKAGDLVSFVARQVGGKGGGRPTMAQGGGDQPEKIATALQSVKQWVSKKHFS